MSEFLTEIGMRTDVAVAATPALRDIERTVGGTGEAAAAVTECDASHAAEVVAVT